MGDMLDLAAVTAATRDITAAYLTYPIAPGLLEATAIFAQAAVESGVSAIVNMSQISARRDAASNAARPALARRAHPRLVARFCHPPASDLLRRVAGDRLPA